MKDLKEECYAWTFLDMQLNTNCKTNKYIMKHRTAGQRLKLLALTKLLLKHSFWNYTQDVILLNAMLINEDKMKQNATNIFPS